jgi:hypothetical protein
MLSSMFVFVFEGETDIKKPRRMQKMKDWKSVPVFQLTVTAHRVQGLNPIKLQEFHKELRLYSKIEEQS